MSVQLHVSKKLKLDDNVATSSSAHEHDNTGVQTLTDFTHSSQVEDSKIQQTSLKSKTQCTEENVTICYDDVETLQNTDITASSGNNNLLHSHIAQVKKPTSSSLKYVEKQNNALYKTTCAGYKCFYCNIQCQSLEKYEQHTVSTHSKKPKLQPILIYSIICQCKQILNSIAEVNLHKCAGKNTVLKEKKIAPIVKKVKTAGNVNQDKSDSTFNNIKQSDVDDYRDTKNVIHFKCFHCFKVFKHENKLVVHMNTYHADEDYNETLQLCADRYSFYYCNVCPFFSKNEDGLKSHKLTKAHLENLNASEQKIQDKIEKEENAEIKNSKLYEITPIGFKCHFCEEQFVTTKKYSAHVVSTHPNKRFLTPNLVYGFVCKICKHILNNNDAIKLHKCVDENEADIEYKKDISSVSCEAEPNLSCEQEAELDPLAIHDMECKICSIVLPNPLASQLHQSKVHSNDMISSYLIDSTFPEFLTQQTVYLKSVHKNRDLTREEELVLCNFDRFEQVVYVCCYCSSEFGSHISFTAHLRCEHSHSVTQGLRYIQQFKSLYRCKECEFACEIVSQCMEHNSKCSHKLPSSTMMIDSCFVGCLCTNVDKDVPVCYNGSLCIKDNCKKHYRILTVYKCCKCNLVFNLCYLLKKHSKNCNQSLKIVSIQLNIVTKYLSSQLNMVTNYLRDSSVNKPVDFRDFRVTSQSCSVVINQDEIDYDIKLVPAFSCPSCPQKSLLAEVMSKHVSECYRGQDKISIGKKLCQAFICKKCKNVLFTIEDQEEHARTCEIIIQRNKNMYYRYCASCKIRYNDVMLYMEHINNMHCKHIYKIPHGSVVNFGCFKCCEIFSRVEHLEVHTEQCGQKSLASESNTILQVNDNSENLIEATNSTLFINTPISYNNEIEKSTTPIITPSLLNLHPLAPTISKASNTPHYCQDCGIIHVQSSLNPSSSNISFKNSYVNFFRVLFVCSKCQKKYLITSNYQKHKIKCKPIELTEYSCQQICEVFKCTICKRRGRYKYFLCFGAVVDHFLSTHNNTEDTNVDNSEGISCFDNDPFHHEIDIKDEEAAEETQSLANSDENSTPNPLQALLYVYQCPTCNEKFDTQDLYNMHYLSTVQTAITQDKSTRYNCTLCKCVFNSFSECSKHIYFSHSAYVGSIQSHILLTDIIVYTCELCDESSNKLEFISRESMETHVRYHGYILASVGVSACRNKTQHSNSDTSASVIQYETINIKEEMDSNKQHEDTMILESIDPFINNVSAVSPYYIQSSANMVGNIQGHPATRITSTSMDIDTNIELTDDCIDIKTELIDDLEITYSM